MKNTRRFILSLSMALLSLATFAQTQIGFKTGLQHSGIVTDLQFGSFKPAKFITNPHLGLVMDIGISNNFSIQPELSYAARGFKIDETFGIGLLETLDLPLGIKFVSKINYLNMPLLAKVKFGNEKVKGYVVAGPEFGYALNGKVKTVAKVFIADIKLFEQAIPFGDLGVDRFDIGATIGAGLSLNTGVGELFFDARYYRGFKDLVNIPLLGSLPLQNQGVQLNVGYMFPIGGSKGSYARR